MQREDLLLEILHGGGFGVVLVIVPEQMQHAMDDQQCQFIVDGPVMLALARMVGSIRRRHSRAHHDVADEVIGV